MDLKYVCGCPCMTEQGIGFQTSRTTQKHLEDKIKKTEKKKRKLASPGVSLRVYNMHEKFRDH